MNWEAMGAIGEIAGALAVVVTLAYLAKQMKNQTQTNEITVFEGVMDGFNQVNSMIAADKELYRVFIRGLNHPDKLDDDDAASFSFVFRAYMNTYNKLYRAYLRGAIEEEVWTMFAAEGADLIESPGGRVFWETSSGDSWEYVQAVRKHLRDDPVIDVSLGRECILRAS